MAHGYCYYVVIILLLLILTFLFEIETFTLSICGYRQDLEHFRHGRGY